MQKSWKIATTLGLLCILFMPIFPSPALATNATGLIQEVYTYDANTIPERQAYTLCSTSVVPNMNFTAGLDTVEGCQADFVLIHWTGYITLGVEGNVNIISAADDGFYLTLDDEVIIDDWILKGCYGSSVNHVFHAGVSQKIDAWYYEYDGGACNSLLYQEQQGEAILIPDEAFTHEETIVEPTPEPTPTPTDEPTKEPEKPVTPKVEPTPQPTETPVLVEPTKTIEKSEVIIPEFLTIDPNSIDPETLSPEDISLLQEAAYNTLLLAEEGSEEYNRALDQLMLIAKTDDIELDSNLAETPIIGALATAVVDAINALGNVGADMSPAHRETAKKEVIAAVILVQITTSVPKPTIKTK